MTLNLEDVFRNSFCLSIDNAKWKNLLKVFRYHRLPIPNRYADKLDAEECQSSTNNAWCKLIQKAKDDDLPYALIFEDDAYPCKNIRKVMQEYLNDIPDDSAFVQFSWSLNENPHENRFNKITKTAFCVCCVLIFKKAYDDVIGKLKEKGIIDSFQHTLNVSYISDKPLFIQYNISRGVCNNIGYDITYDTMLRQPGYFEQNFDTIETINEASSKPREVKKITNNDDIVVTNVFSGRFGNWCLQLYKTFWYCQRHGIPFDKVHIPDMKAEFVNEDDQYRFGNMKQYFNSTRTVNNPNKFYGSSKQFLIDNPPCGKDMEFSEYNWLYPETDDDLQLFGELFINKEQVRRIRNEYHHLFDGVTTTIGLTIRRGDFIRLPDFYLLSDYQILDLFNTYMKLSNHSTRFIVDSDDIPYVRNLLENNKFNMDNIVFLDGVRVPDTLVILSLCTTVVSNGRFWLADNFEGKHESTYGQIAQCMNRAYKYII